MGTGSNGFRAGVALFALAMFVALGVPADVRAGAVEAHFGKETLPFPWVTGVFRDGDDVWVATKGGTRIYDLRRKEWRPAPAGLVGTMVTGLARFNGALYVATEKALNVGGPGGFKAQARIRNADAMNGELVPADKSLWMAARTMVGGLLRYDGAAWSLLSRGEGTGVMNNITCLAAWRGEMWAGTSNNGIFLYKSGKWTVLGPEDGLPGLWITALAGADDGIYAGTPSGLALYSGEKWRIFRQADGLPSNKVSALKVYRNKVVIGTFDGGLSVFDGRRFRNIGQDDGLTDRRIQALQVVDDTAFVGTINGLFLVRLPR